MYLGLSISKYMALKGLVQNRKLSHKFNWFGLRKTKRKRVERETLKCLNKWQSKGATLVIHLGNLLISFRLQKHPLNEIRRPGIPLGPVSFVGQNQFTTSNPLQSTLSYFNLCYQMKPTSTSFNPLQPIVIIKFHSLTTLANIGR